MPVLGQALTGYRKQYSINTQSDGKHTSYSIINIQLANLRTSRNRKHTVRHAIINIQ